GNEHRKPRTPADTRDHLDRMIEQLPQSLDDCEAEPQPAAVVRPLRAEYLVELAEDASPLILGDPDSGVAYIDAQACAATPASDDNAAGSGVAGRVRDEIEENPLQQNEIGVHPAAAGNDAQLQSLFAHDRGERRLQSAQEP